METVRLGLESARSVNMAVIFRAITAGGCVSRSELVLQTGLSRKTVGAVVQELAERRLVDESEPVSRGVGRPSHAVRPSRLLTALVLRLGAGALELTSVGLDGVPQKSAQYRLDRPHSAEGLAKIVVAVAESMAAPGAHPSLGIAVMAGNGQGGPGVDPQALVRSVECRLGIPVFTTTDGIAAALAESRFGAGSGVRDMIYLRDGEGGAAVGGAFVNGALVIGHRGRAGSYGELGIDRIRSSAHSAADPCGDPARRIAAALAPLCQVLDPELVVLGGAYARSVPSVREHLRSRFVRRLEDLPIVMASELHDELVIGGALTVFDRVLSEPHRFPVRAPAPATAG